MLPARPWWRAPQLPCPTGCRGARPTAGRSRTNPSTPNRQPHVPQYAAPPQYAQPAPPPAAPDPIEQLTKLAALKEQGILTDEEFAAQKAKILSA